MFPIYDVFIHIAALEIIENGGGDDKKFDDTVLDIITNRCKSSRVSFEIFLKLPQTFRDHVQNMITYFRENNDYNYD